MPRFLLALCLLCAACVNAAARQEPAQISVEGLTLNGPFSTPQQRGGRLFLPLVQIARALGDVVQTDAASRTVRVQRQTGVRADFDAALNLVRENGATVLVLSGADDIDFPPQPEALMLPAEVASALLGVSIQTDASARVVSVRRGQALSAPVSSTKRQGPLEVFGAEYEYNLGRYPTGYNHHLTLRTDGRLLDGRFAFTGNLYGATRQGPASLQGGTFAYERPNGQRLAAGDIGVAGELTFMSSLARGLWAQIPVGPARLSAFFGRSAGGHVAPTPFVGPRPGTEPEGGNDAARPDGRTFDTRVAGAYATFGRPGAGAYRSTALQFSAGVMAFDGPARRGRLLTGALRASSARYGLHADFAAGSFSGLREDGVRAEGKGAAADISGSFNVRENLTVQGHFTFNSRNFMTAQAGSAPSLNLRSLGVTWSPARWLTASVTDTASARPNRPRSRERFTTATFNVTPPRFLSNLFVSHTEYSTPQVRGGSYTLVNASKGLGRWHLFASGSRIKGSGDAYQHAQLGARLRLRETDSLQASQTFGSNRMLAGTVDWTTQSLLTKRVSLGAGLGYSSSANSRLSIYERLHAGVSLPFGQTLQLSYGHLQSGSQLNVSLRGPLFLRRRLPFEADLAAAELSKYGTVSGRVYQDLNFNGRFDADIDQPQSNVRVRVDGNLSVTTDRGGLYHIANAPAGEHTVALDLLSVRADLTILGQEAQAVSLAAGFDTVVDFRTARTGRVAGTVWLDLNNNGIQEADEQALADVRVVTSTGRDTLTDEQGRFVVGDLAPGLHVLVVDTKTLPDETIVRALQGAQGPTSAAQTPAAGSLQVTVRAGAENGDIRFAVSPKPPERKQF